MKWENKGRQFDRFAEEWNSSCEYYLWGASHTCRCFLADYGKILQVKGIADGNPQRCGELFDGHRICSPADLLKFRGNGKIIVTSLAYWEIRLSLLRAGLEENRDFCDSRLFNRVFQMYRNHKLYLPRVDIALTDKCTLNCRDCNMGIPCFKAPRHRDMEEMKADLAALFRRVDCLEKLNLVGGEPFLFPRLPELLEHLHDCYHEKVRAIEFFSNATIVPAPDVLSVCARYGITVQISDYSPQIPNCGSKVDRLIRILDEYRIGWSRFRLDKWIDFGLMNREKEDCGEEQMIRFFDLCAPPFRGLRNKKFYFCHLECSMVHSGVYPGEANDYFDLSEENSAGNMELMEFDAGYSRLGYVTFCRRCHGCNAVNTREIPGAVQQERGGNESF